MTNGIITNTFNLQIEITTSSTKEEQPDHDDWTEINTKTYQKERKGQAGISSCTGKSAGRKQPAAASIQVLIFLYDEDAQRRPDVDAMDHDDISMCDHPKIRYNYSSNQRSGDRWTGKEMALW